MGCLKNIDFTILKITLLVFFISTVLAAPKPQEKPQEISAKKDDKSSNDVQLSGGVAAPSVRKDEKLAPPAPAPARRQSQLVKKGGDILWKQDQGQKNFVENRKQEVKEVIPLHGLPPGQRQENSHISHQESSQYNKQDMAVPAQIVMWSNAMTGGSNAGMSSNLGLPGLPKLGEMPQLQPLNSPYGNFGLFGLPQMPGLPQMSGLPQMYGLPGLNVMPGVPQVSGATGERAASSNTDPNQVLKPQPNLQVNFQEESKSAASASSSSSKFQKTSIKGSI